MINRENVRSASTTASNFATNERVFLSTRKERYDGSRVWKKMAFAKGKVGFFRRKVELCENYVKVHTYIIFFMRSSSVDIGNNQLVTKGQEH